MAAPKFLCVALFKDEKRTTALILRHESMCFHFSLSHRTAGLKEEKCFLASVFSNICIADQF